LTTPFVAATILSGMKKALLATDCIYHIYNRGVEKRKIFLDPGYHHRFLSILKHHLNYDYAYSLLERSLKEARSAKEKEEIFRRLEARRIEPPLEIISFCLMPNHYHLTLKQSVENGISDFMHRLGTSYTNYFNIRQERSGRLFETSFKAVRVESEEQLLHLSRYQHLNPLTLGLTPKELVNYSWSSLPVYLGRRETSFVKPAIIISAFKNPKSYLDFVLAEVDAFEPVRLEEVAIDDDFGWFTKFREMEKEYKSRLRERYIRAITRV
jgi:putative transposase